MSKPNNIYDFFEPFTITDKSFELCESKQKEFLNEVHKMTYGCLPPDEMQELQAEMLEVGSRYLRRNEREHRMEYAKPTKKLKL